MNTNIEFIIIVSAFLLTLIFIEFSIVLFDEGPKKWKALLDSTQVSGKRKNSFLTKEQEKKTKKSIKEILKNKKFYQKWKKKVTYFYWQAGIYNKTIDEFIVDVFKYAGLSVLYFFALFFFMHNLIIAIAPALLLFFYPSLDLYIKISNRRSQFKGSFPFFLKTLGFVMSNGANPINALTEVTHKSEKGVLKEIMEDVLSEKTLNGGNFEDAFDVLVLKMNIPEVKEFVDTLKNSSSKGVSIADTFNSQSEAMDKMLKNVKKKKISNVENKILFPIIMSIASIAVLILSL